MLRRLRKVLKNNSGFTILELIVVIAIMGFLVALVAPKLVGVADSSKAPICDTNQKRLADALGRTIQQRGVIPSGLTNLVLTSDSTKFEAGLPVKSVSDTTATKNKWMWGEDEAVSAEFSRSLVMDNHLYVHHLNNSEKAELDKMGVKELIDYETGERNSISNVNYVLMIGSGAGEDTGAPAGELAPDGSRYIKRGDVEKTSITGHGFANPELAYRIVLGVGEESDLIKDKVTSSIGVCPTSTQNKKFIKYNNYLVVLPRLKATADRAGDRTTIRKREGLDTKGNKITPSEEIKLKVAQDMSQIITLCPEGHQWPSPDVKLWTITTVAK